MLVVDKTPLGAWHRLLGEAQYELGYFLPEDIECYLAFTLIRFTDNAHFMKNAIALDFLHSLETRREDSLRDVGDKCLLIGGLFPEHASNRNLSDDYYKKVGQSAYGVIAADASNALYPLYQSLSESFGTCTEVLSALRRAEKAVKECANVSYKH